MFLLDTEGVITLIVTLVGLVAFLYLKGHKIKEVSPYIKKLDIIPAFLIFVGIIALWLSIRVTALDIERFLTKSFIYTQFQIFDMIAYALTANLCFSLSSSLQPQGIGVEERVNYIVDATMQATLIGIIVLLPRWSDVALMGNLQANSFGFVLVLLGLALTLLMLMYVRKSTRTPARTNRIDTGIQSA